MRLFLPCRFFIGLSLLSSCLIFRFVFTSILPSTGYLRSQFINEENSLLSDLRSMGQSEIIGANTQSKELLLRTFHNESLEHIQSKVGNEGQKWVSNEREHKHPTILLSSNRSVKSDVQGNLGPPSVITSESISNWLTDRWQGKISGNISILNGVT